MSSILKADIWQTSAGVAVKTPINYQYHRWETSTVVNSTSYTDVTDSSFSYTPKRVGSLLHIMGEVSASPANTAGGDYAGMTWAIFINGVEYGKQTQSHEIYMAGGTDLYVSRTTKSVYYTVANLNALTIKIMVKNYVATNNGRINQGIWESYIHVWEIAQ